MRYFTAASMRYVANMVIRMRYAKPDGVVTMMGDASTRMLHQNAVSNRQSSARIGKALQDQETMVSESALLGYLDCPIAFSDSVIRQAFGSMNILRQYVGAYRYDHSCPWITIQSKEKKKSRHEF
jgi:hypothetical protein